jgi:hypothetical protein
MPRLAPLALAALAAACSSDPAGGPDGGGDPAVPITARPSRNSLTCRIARDRTDHSPRQWQRQQALTVTTGGIAYLARVEAIADNPISPIIPGKGRLIVSRFATDGTFGDPITISDADWMTVYGVAITRVGDGFGVVWVEGSDLRFAAFDAQARPTLAPRTIKAGGFGYFSGPRIAEGPGGRLGVVYTTDGMSAPPQVMFFTMDAAGTAGATRKLGDGVGQGAAPGPTLVGDADGFALVWTGAALARGQIVFAKTDGAGAELVAPRAISSPAAADVIVGGITGFDSPAHGLVRVDGGYLAAWAEVRITTYPAMGAWSVVKVARLDATGAVQGKPAPLRAPAPDIDEVEPSLLRFGSAVVVMWARGTRIYVCGGCIPDHRIDTLAIDPATLEPLSDVVTILPGPNARSGGLLRRDTGVVGSSLLTTFNLTFHVHATPGSATLACDPR